MEARSVIVTGFMGAGKSEIGPRLAVRLGIPFEDMDVTTVRREGRSIKELFRPPYGEAYFRQRESSLLRELLTSKPVVIATGGGTLIDPANCTFAREHGTVVLLKVSYDVAYRRIMADGKDGKRPLFDGDSRARFDFRQPVYERCAHITVDADRPADQVVEHIIQALASV